MVAVAGLLYICADEFPHEIMCYVHTILLSIAFVLRSFPLSFLAAAQNQGKCYCSLTPLYCGSFTLFILCVCLVLIFVFHLTDRIEL